MFARAPKDLDYSRTGNSEGGLYRAIIRPQGDSIPQGRVRDILSAQVPAVLRGEIYAVAALTGAAVVVVGRLLQLPSTAATITGAIICFSLRFVAIRRSWTLPVARGVARPGAE